MSVETTNGFIGDDGFYSNSEDILKFMKYLIQVKIFSNSSLSLMKEWVNKDCGLGLMYDKSFPPYKQVIGHTGRDIGSTADVHYFPKQYTYLFCQIQARA